MAVSYSGSPKFSPGVFICASLGFAIPWPGGSNPASF